jgi:hypothetical protein
MSGSLGLVQQRAHGEMRGGGDNDREQRPPGPETTARADEPNYDKRQPPHAGDDQLVEEAARQWPPRSLPCRDDQSGVSGQDGTEPDQRPLGQKLPSPVAAQTPVTRTPTPATSAASPVNADTESAFTTCAPAVLAGRCA